MAGRRLRIPLAFAESLAWRTARLTGPNPSFIKFVNEYIMTATNPKILDYGAGLLRHTYYLINLGYTVYIHDPLFEYIETEKRIVHDNTQRNYTHIICTFVLNVCLEYKREAILKHIYLITAEEGRVLIIVRGKNSITARTRERLYDGWNILQTKTFQKGYSLEELEEYLKRYNFEIETIYTQNLNRDIAVVIKKNASTKT